MHWAAFSGLQGQQPRATLLLSNAPQCVGHHARNRRQWDRKLPSESNSLCACAIYAFIMQGKDLPRNLRIIAARTFKLRCWSLEDVFKAVTAYAEPLSP